MEALSARSDSGDTFLLSACPEGLSLLCEGVLSAEGLVLPSGIFLVEPVLGA